MDSKQPKRIAIVEASGELAESVLRFVEDKYTLKFTNSTDADYVIHSCHGYDVLKYSGVRIFISGENVSPNFAISDYAMTFEKLFFGDRYTWLPLIKLYRESYAALNSSRPDAQQIASQKSDFCAYVMSNTTNSADERTQVFELISKYKTVNSGGRWRNNVGGRVPDKKIFQSKHKFVIAFENCSHPGYLTEKFADAAASNAIPIYWGDPDITSIFNPKAFINCHDFQTFEDVVDRVREIDTDDKLYHEILSEPWFVNETEPECLSDSHFSDFLSNIFDQPHESAYRRNRGRWGIKKERQLHNMWAKPHIHCLKTLKKHWRDFRKSSRAKK